MKRELLFTLVAFTLLASPLVSWGQAPNLGTTASFAVFTATGALTNTGASVVAGDIGTNVGAFSGFNLATVVGQTHVADATSAQAAADVDVAYSALSGVTCDLVIATTLGNNQVLTPGVYCLGAAATLTGNLTLDGQNNPNALFIIRIDGALSTATLSNINLINGASCSNVYFQVNGAVSLGTNSIFKGTILANGPISLLEGASLEGRALSRGGAIDLHNNVVSATTLSLSGSSVTVGACNPATNLFSLSGTVSLTNALAGTVTLTDGTASATVSVSAGTTSVPYSLTGLTSGTDSHTVTASYGCKVTSVTYTAPASCSTAPATLGGLVFADNNSDGSQNGSDTPIEGVEVTLLDGTSTPITSTTTDAGGLYSFTGLTAGIPYSVSFTTPTGYSATVPNLSGPLTLTSGENTSLNVGFFVLTAILGGSVFSDNNNDGIQDGGDTPIEGVEVTLYTNGVVALATTTDVSGLYSFTGLTPGSSVSYAVGFTTPSGLTATLADQGGDDALDSDADLITGRTQSVTLGPGENNPDLDAGFYALCSVITPTVTVGSCLTATNTFSSTVVVTVNNPVTGQTLTITDGASSQPFATTAGTSNTFTMVINGLPSDGSTRTITATLPGCSSATVTYTAPASCSVAPPACSIATPAVTVGPCLVATNTYSATVVVTLSNTIGGVLTVSNGVQSLTTNVATGLGTFPFTVVFNGLSPNGTTQNITASLPGCGSALTTYTAPASCSAGSPVNPMLELEKIVNQSTAIVGDTLTYSLVLTNIGSTSAATTVRDSLSSGASYVANSAVAPAGTTFTPGTPSLWNVPSIAAGQSLTLTFQVRVDSSGVLYNTATVPGDTAKVCTSVPIKLCLGDEYTLTAPAGRASYAWFRDGVLIEGATTNSLTVTQGGSYSLNVSGAGSSCPDFSCCPVIVEVDSLPVFTAVAIPATCLGNAPQANGRLVISGFDPTHTYQYSAGATFNPAVSLSGPAQVIPAGGVLTNNLVSPVSSMMYTVRVYNSAGCYVDQTVILIPTICGCPVNVCIPYVVSQTKRAVRIGDPR